MLRTVHCEPCRARRRELGGYVPWPQLCEPCRAREQARARAVRARNPNPHPRRVPAARFRAWLWAYIEARRTTRRRAAAELRIPERRVRAVLNGTQSRVSITTIDVALTNAACVVEVGRSPVFTLDDLCPSPVPA